MSKGVNLPLEMPPPRTCIYPPSHLEAPKNKTGRLALFFLRLGLNRLGLNEVPDCPYHHITQGDIGFVGNGLKLVFFVRGNADCHDPVASFWQGREGRGYTEDCKIPLGPRTLYGVAGVLCFHHEHTHISIPAPCFFMDQPFGSMPAGVDLFLCSSGPGRRATRQPFPDQIRDRG